MGNIFTTTAFSKNSAICMNGATPFRRRTLLAASSLLMLELTGCGGINDGGNGSAPSPTVTAVSPAGDSTVGGTTITIIGTNLTGATTVLFGTVAATNVTVVSASQITATAPAHVAGGVVVSVTTAGGTASMTRNFVYLASNAGVVTTLAGSGNSTPFADGAAASATFNNPKTIAVDSNGNVYVGDTYDNCIRTIASDSVSTLAGSGTGAFADGTGASASFMYPAGLATDANGTIYVGDTGNNRIRKITPTGVVTTLAGSGSAAYADGSGASASFFNPTGVAVDVDGYVYVADTINNRIRKITPTGVVTTLAGSGSATYADGSGASASFFNPTGVGVDVDGNVYVADKNNHRIRKITPSGDVTTLAGSGTAAYTDGASVAASFNGPTSVAVDMIGNVYVADTGNNCIRMVTQTGIVTTLAGSTAAAYVDGTGVAASFYLPKAIAVDSSGVLYVADQFNNRIRKIT